MFAAANLVSLENLDIYECHGLNFMIEGTEEAFSSLTSLQQLRITDCSKLTPLSLQNLVSLMKSEIIRCRDLNSEGTEAEFSGLTSHRKLWISGCSKLTFLQNLVSLEVLEIYNCNDMDSIIERTEEAFSGLASLQQLRIFNCSELTCLPKRLPQTLVTLQREECPKLIMPNPDELSNLTSLQTLAIVSCPGLASCWDEALLCLTSLRRLKIGRFLEELKYFAWPLPSTDAAAADAATVEITVVDTDIHHHPQQCPFVFLESLVLVGWPMLKTLSDQLQHLIALTELSIEHFYGLEYLPDWLGNLSSLQSLKLRFCKNLMGLPSLEAMQRLTQLLSLAIEDCPLLVERCRSGLEWHNISHIPFINFILEW